MDKDKLQAWIEHVNTEEFKYPDKTFGNKPHYFNQFDIKFLQTMLKELTEVEKEAKQVLSNVSASKSKVITLLNKNNAYAGKIF